MCRRQGDMLANWIFQKAAGSMFKTTMSRERVLLFFLNTVSKLERQSVKLIAIYILIHT